MLFAAVPAGASRSAIFKKGKERESCNLGDWIDQLIAGSQRRYREAWSQMAWAGPSPRVESGATVDLAIAGVLVGLFNAAFPRGPIPGASLLREIAGESRDAFSRHGLPGMLTMPSSWLPARSEEILAEYGFRHEIRNAGMRTARLSAPKWYPSRLPVERLAPDSAAEIMAEVNGGAYGMPPDEWRSLVLPGFWDAPNVRAYAIRESGEAAAVGASLIVEDCCYILWMATRIESRGKGYAEKIIRAAWDDTREAGAKLTVLHATPAGRPVYARMGYTLIADFPGFVWSPRA
jgi:GNAT superfamily N-acetyltransferase